MTPLRRPLVLSLAVVVLGPLAAAAEAQGPVCGQVLTQSVRLQESLRCPDTNGLVVGADGITIDLNGRGIHQGIGFRGPGVAIDNTGGFDGVTIKNGGVGADGHGIRLAGASGNRLIDVSATGGVAGISIEGGAGNRIVRGVVGGFASIEVSGSDLLRITGTRMTSGQSGSRVTGSSAVISGNTLSDGGMSVSGNGNRVANNVVSGALDVGIRIGSGADNVVVGNWVVGTRPVFSPADATGDGIQVGAFTAGTVVRENITVGNGEDGIDVEGPGARLVRNLANGNTDLGIDARPGTFASGNTASGNGNPAQCAGITCG